MNPLNEGQIAALIAGVMGVPPRNVTHMTFGHNSVTYSVALPDREVIVRTNENAAVFADTERNMSILARLGLPVPRVLFSDLTKTTCRSAYLILDKIPGRDLRYELSGMTAMQMTRLAAQIVGFQRTVATLPPGNSFGYVSIGSRGRFATWRELFENELRVAIDCRDDPELAPWTERIRVLLPFFYPYFAQVSPTCFLDDITVKNVIVEDGELRGLIDFDVVCYGDPLFNVGLTAAGVIADVGEHRLVYVEELCRLWGLKPLQYQVVRLYSALFAIAFLLRSEYRAADGWSRRAIAAVKRWVTELEVYWHDK
ncbi:MAG: aminoglycoside phosphotransferase family protein [Fibrella sp.]|nr:aminoglycoside phosphotransferase family protein [Armatimonadota bacterium]